MLCKILNYFHNRRVEKEQKLRKHLTELEEKMCRVVYRKGEPFIPKRLHE